MEDQIKKLQKISKKKEVKTEITCFKLTKSRKRELTAIRDTYGKSYGVIINLLIEITYQAMLKDEYTKLLSDAKKTDGLSDESLAVLKHLNPEAHRLAVGLIDDIDKRNSNLHKKATELVSINNLLKEIATEFANKVKELGIIDKKEITTEEKNDFLSIVQKVLRNVVEIDKKLEPAI